MKEIIKKTIYYGAICALAINLTSCGSKSELEKTADKFGIKGVKKIEMKKIDLDPYFYDFDKDGDLDLMLTDYKDDKWPYEKQINLVAVNNNNNELDPVLQSIPKYK